MPQATTSGGQQPAKKPEETIVLSGDDRIVLTKVEVIRHREIIKVPEIIIVPQETTKYETVVEPTTRYEVETLPTTRYDEKTEQTTRYVTRDEETIRYIPRDEIYTVEKPVYKEVEYERPIIHEKVYEVVKYEDIVEVRKLVDMAPKILAMLDSVQEKLSSLKEYEIIKEVIKVPAIQYVPTTIKRVGKTGELIDDAN